MSVIAWDGKTLAADTRSICSGLKTSVSKIFPINKNTIIAWTGQQDHGLALRHWFIEESQSLEKWPSFQVTNEWTRLIVAKENNLFYYEQTPFKQYHNYNENFAAFGSGRDYALGAMAMGANAVEAVEVACRFSVDCGLPVEFYRLEVK